MECISVSLACDVDFLNTRKQYICRCRKQSKQARRIGWCSTCALLRQIWTWAIFAALAAVSLSSSLCQICGIQCRNPDPYNCTLQYVHPTKNSQKNSSAKIEHRHNIGGISYLFSAIARFTFAAERWASRRFGFFLKIFKILCPNCLFFRLPYFVTHSG